MFSTMCRSHTKDIPVFRRIHRQYPAMMNTLAFFLRRLLEALKGAGNTLKNRAAVQKISGDIPFSTVKESRQERENFASQSLPKKEMIPHEAHNENDGSNDDFDSPPLRLQYHESNDTGAKALKGSTGGHVSRQLRQSHQRIQSSSCRFT